MIETRYYCDKCGHDVKFNKAKEYTIRWEDKYFDHSTKILLCKECAMNFHRNVLHCRWEE